MYILLNSIWIAFFGTMQSGLRAHHFGGVHQSSGSEDGRKSYHPVSLMIGNFISARFVKASVMFMYRSFFIMFAIINCQEFLLMNQNSFWKNPKVMQRILHGTVCRNMK